MFSRTGRSTINIKKIMIGLKILFIVSFVFILHHKTNVLKPFDDLMFIFQSFVSLENPASKEISSLDKSTNEWEIFSLSSNREEVNVAVIPKNYYFNKFAGISPLDRCCLAQNLRDLLANNRIKFVIFDIDLSPLPDGDIKNPVFKYYKYCQNKLDSLLMLLISKGKKLILLDPKDFYEETIPLPVMEWKKFMEEKGVVFASAKSHLSMGIALRYKLDNTLVGKLLSLLGKEEGKQNEEVILNYNFNLRNLKEPDSNIIFIGAGYGKDFFFTPAGILPGTFIHALAFLSSLEPKEEKAYIGFLLDLTFAVIFYFVFAKLWNSILLEKRYLFFDLKYISLVLFILFFAFASMFISYLFFEVGNILTSPIPILIGLIYDALSNSLLEQCRETLKIESFANNIYLIFKIGFMLAVVIYALILMLEH